MIRKLITASTILGAVALLSNKARRDRIATALRGLLESTVDKAEKITDKTSVERSPAHASPPAWVRPGGY